MSRVMRRTVLLVAVALFVTVAPVLAQSESTGITGSVVNGTLDGAPVQGLTVTLEALRPDGGIADTFNSETDRDGLFRFSDVEVEQGILYRVVVEFGGARYFGEGRTATDLFETPLDILVYETTESDEAVHFAQQTSVVVEVDQTAGFLRVIEDTTVANDSLLTYVGERDAGGQISTVRIPLPPFAFDVVPGLGFGADGFLVADGGIADVSPLAPGERDMLYGYNIAYVAQSHSLARTYQYPIDVVRLLVPRGLEVEAIGMNFVEPVDIAGEVYDAYVANAVQPGQAVGLTLINLPTSAGQRSRTLTETLRWVAVGGLAIAVSGLLAYAIFLRRREAADALPELAVDGLRADVVERLAQIEEEFRDGHIDESQYQMRRREERLRLREGLAPQSQEETP